MRLPNRNQKVRGEIDRFGGNRECSEMTTARAPDAVVDGLSLRDLCLDCVAVRMNS